MAQFIAIAPQHRVETDITVIPHANQILVRKIVIAATHIRNVKVAYVNHHVTLIHVQTLTILIVRIFTEEDMFVHVLHRHAVAGTNAKVRLPVFRTIRTLRIQDCAKS